MTDEMGPLPSTVCRQCQQPLNRVEVDGVLNWVHPGWDAGHEPEPIPRTEATAVAYVCDFCGGSKDVVYAYSTPEEIRMVMAIPTFLREREKSQFAKNWSTESNKPGPADDRVENRYSKRWVACRRCSEFIEIPDMERLITHVRRFDPEHFATYPMTRTLLRAQFGEFFRAKGEREPIEPPPSGEPEQPPGDGHRHAFDNLSAAADPDGLPVDLDLLNELLGAAFDGCRSCPATHIARLVEDPTTCYGLVDLSCRAVNAALGFVPPGMTDPSLPQEVPFTQSLAFRTVVAASANGHQRPAAAAAAAQLSAEERRALVEDALDLVVGMMSVETET